MYVCYITGQNLDDWITSTGDVWCNQDIYCSTYLTVWGSSRYLYIGAATWSL